MNFTIYFNAEDVSILRSLLEEYLDTFELFESEAYGAASKDYCQEYLARLDEIFDIDATSHPRLDEYFLFALQNFITGVMCSYMYPITNEKYTFKRVRQSLDLIRSYLNELEAHSFSSK